MSLAIPDGYFLDDYQVHGHLGKGGILSRGYAVEFPDLSASDDEAFLELESDIRLILSALGADERLQLQFYTSSDFEAPLDRYLAHTRASSRIPIVSQVRDELVFRYRARMDAQTLIQTNCRLYLSSKLPPLALTGDKKKVRGFDEIFRVLRRSFEQREQFFDLLLRQYGGSCVAFDNQAHYREMLSFWSPGQARIWHPENIDWLRTIEDLCRFSGLAPTEQGFHLDGQHFGVLVAKTMPRSTWAKTMEPFFALTIPNLRLVVNMEPLAVDAEIRYEEDRFAKLVSNLDPRSPSLQSEVGLDKHRERMRRLMSNQVLPFRAQVIVIAHDRSSDGLATKMEALRAAIGKTGAESYAPGAATSSIAFFNCATPGVGPWLPYRDYRHKIDDLNLANMWPAGSTPRADLDRADWIADGDNNNLMGGRLFLGAQPVHMLVAASSGAGKTSLLQTIALQTGLDFELLVVIDDGLSWLTTCQRLDPSGAPIVVRSNGGLTFNIFDTLGNPLSPEHLASATALVSLLAGSAVDQDKDKLRSGLISEAIQHVYGVAYRAWRNREPRAHFDACQQTKIIMRFQEARGLQSFTDAFQEAAELRKAEPEGLLEYEHGLGSADEILALDLDPATGHLVQNLAFSSWSHEMFPTLFDLQDELAVAGSQRGAHRELCATLAVLLRPWLRDGRYGPIMDGASNVDLGSVSTAGQLKVVHFELGEMGKSEAELKSVIGFLITNQVRNHIQRMPRRVRKQVIIEEMTSFLKVPNGEEIVVDYYERMRKYSAQVISVFQQYSSLLEAHPKVAKAIIGNSAAMLLLRNTNWRDLETLSGFVRIPDVIKGKLASFPLPESMKGRPDAYAGFVYVQLDGHEPRFTVGRNVISQEVEKLTSSSGDVTFTPWVTFAGSTCWWISMDGTPSLKLSRKPSNWAPTAPITSTISSPTAAL